VSRQTVVSAAAVVAPGDPVELPSEKSRRRNDTGTGDLDIALAAKDGVRIPVLSQ
jgi:hypothetical protein